MVLTVPGTTLDLLGPQTAKRMSAHDVVCLHTMAGGFEGTDAMFHANGFKGTESHLGMRWDGFTKEWQDLFFRADANFEGNPRVISIETEDVDSHFPDWYPNGIVPSWTGLQVAKITALLRTLCSKAFHSQCPSTWKCHQVGIPMRLIKNSGADQRGIGYHRQGIDGDYPGPYKGRQGVGEHWSTSGGKVCPGDNRIHQLIDVIIPSLAGGPDLDATEHAALLDIQAKSKAMFKAIRNDEDADQELVAGLREHVRWVLDDASTESGSDLRTMVGDKSKDALDQYDAAQKSDLIPPATP